MTYTVLSGTLNSTIPYHTIPSDASTPFHMYRCILLYIRSCFGMIFFGCGTLCALVRCFFLWMICDIRLKRKRKDQHGRRRLRRKEWSTSLQLPTRLLALIQMNQYIVSASRYTYTISVSCYSCSSAVTAWCLNYLLIIHKFHTREKK